MQSVTYFRDLNFYRIYHVKSTYIYPFSLVVVLFLTKTVHAYLRLKRGQEYLRLVEKSQLFVCCFLLKFQFSLKQLRHDFSVNH